MEHREIGDEVELLMDHANEARKAGSGPHAGDVDSMKQDAAGGGLQQSAHDSQDRGLAGAARPQDGDGLALPDGKGKVLHRDLPAVAHGHAVQRQGRDGAVRRGRGLAANELAASG